MSEPAAAIAESGPALSDADPPSVHAAPAMSGAAPALKAATAAAEAVSMARKHLRAEPKALALAPLSVADPRWASLDEADQLTLQVAELLPPFRLSPKERQQRRTRCGRHVPQLAQHLATLVDEVPVLGALGRSGDDLRGRRARVAKLEDMVVRLRDLADWSADLLLREKSALSDDCQAVLDEARLLGRSRSLGEAGARVAAKLATAEGLLAERQAGIEKERKRRARLRQHLGAAVPPEIGSGQAPDETAMVLGPSPSPPGAAGRGRPPA